jgi:hypothetical protein
MAVTLVLLKEINYEMHHLGRLRWHDMHTKFHKDWYTYVCLWNIRGILRRFEMMYSWYY